MTVSNVLEQNCYKSENIVPIMVTICYTVVKHNRLFTGYSNKLLSFKKDSFLHSWRLQGAVIFTFRKIHLKILRRNANAGIPYGLINNGWLNQQALLKIANMLWMTTLSQSNTYALWKPRSRNPGVSMAWRGSQADWLRKACKGCVARETGNENQICVCARTTKGTFCLFLCKGLAGQSICHSSVDEKL